jgi:hypothetical protein
MDLKQILNMEKVGYEQSLNYAKISNLNKIRI